MNPNPNKVTRLKMSISHMGNKNSMFGLRGKLSPHFGKPRSNKTKQNISESLKNRKFKIRTKLKMRESRMDWLKHHVHNRLGTHHTKRTKLKISKTKKTQIVKFNQKRKNTQIEKLIQQELKKQNIKFKKHVQLIGHPDIFIEPNICIFADGNLYHANPERFKANNIVPKLNKTAKQIWNYDKTINYILNNNNYIVLRFWESDIKKDIKLVINKIKKVIK